MALITGTVIDEAGRPVAGVPVFVESAPVAMPDVALLTDDEGRFVLGAPVGGSYVIGCAGDGGARACAQVDLGPGDATVTLVLRGDG